MIHSRIKRGHPHFWKVEEDMQNVWNSVRVSEKRYKRRKNLLHFRTELSQPQHKVYIHSKTGCALLRASTLDLFFQNWYSWSICGATVLSFSKHRKSFRSKEPVLKDMGISGVISGVPKNSTNNTSSVRLILNHPVSFSPRTIAEIEQWQRGTERRRYWLL